MVRVACIQFKSSKLVNPVLEKSDNLNKAISLIRMSTLNGSNIVVLHELPEFRYFCQKEDPSFFAYSVEPRKNSFDLISGAAKKFGVVIPFSFFENDDNCYFNSVVVFDADGENLGIYRKSHIPCGPGYQEKYFFRPGNTGFKVFKTRFGNIGIGICWDQWFPEQSRILTLKNADLLVFPTAIGNEPHDPSINSLPHWRRTIKGNAAANIIPIAVANRIGKEDKITFFGNSFICDQYGKVVAKSSVSEDIIYADFDFDSIKRIRANWGLIRDRRPDLYRELTSSFCKKANLRVIAEFEEHKCCHILWPVDRHNWKNDCEDARRGYGDVVMAISKYGGEVVKIWANPKDFNDVKWLYDSYENVEVHKINYDSGWSRDTCNFLLELIFF
ncbi:hypothetical protein MHBO_002368 [Bonamia ostreae]|uniref:CN hydrolase domain-containing protein n=1 Tax=Bonamia ostreae TaxID=126728 RepID=A0ABV2AM32_9EUKA